MTLDNVLFILEFFLLTFLNLLPFLYDLNARFRYYFKFFVYYWLLVLVNLVVAPIATWTWAPICGSNPTRAVKKNMTSSDSNSSGSVPFLPEEVLSRIFSHLPSRDRKSVRLTCRLFYDACNIRAIHANEEFVFCDEPDAEIISFLCNVKRSIWNITLHSLDFSDKSKVEMILPFFQQHGGNVRSLTLFNCRLKSRRCRSRLRQIIEPCESLRAFNLHNFRNHENMDRHSFDGFKTLQKNEIIRKTVTHLTIDGLTSSSLTKQHLLSIFAVFPNVEQLEIGADVTDYFEIFNATQVTSKGVLTFSSVYNQLMQIRDQLKALKLSFAHAHHQFCSFSTKCLTKCASIEMKNLEKFSFDTSIAWDAYCTNPFLKFENLTEFECSIGKLSGTSKSEFLILLLSTLTKLHSLSLKTADVHGFRMEKECFEALLKCRLTTFTFQDSRLGPQVYDSSIFSSEDQSIFRPQRMSAYFEPSENHLLPNYTLKHFRVKYVDYNFPALLSTYFRNVDSLIVPEVRADILENILLYQSNLRYLKLYDTTEVNALREWSRNRDPSLPRRLDQIVHLHVVDKNLSLNLLKFLLDEFVFPKLKSLTLQVAFVSEHSAKANIKPLVQLLPQVTQLEHLEVRGYLLYEDNYATRLPFERWLIPVFEVVSKMKLQFFSYYPADKMSFEDHEKQCFQWLDMCPSLHMLLAKGTSKYVRDPISRKVTVSKPAFPGDTSVYRGFPDEYCTKLSELFCDTY